MKVDIHPLYHPLTSFIEALPGRFEAEGETLHQGRNVVKQYQVKGVQLVVKRYKRPNLIQRLTYTFFNPSKAARAYRYAALLRQNGIDTPHEVACLETYRHGLIDLSYFVSLPCHYPPVSRQLYVVDGEEITPSQTSLFDHHLADCLAAFFVELHSKGILHGDLNLSNILCTPLKDGNYHFFLIDTNRSQFKHPTPDECLEDLKRTTHKRNVLTYIIARYADLRGWSQRQSVDKIISKINRFERKNRIKHAFNRCKKFK